MALILNLDERSCVQVTSEKVARHDAAKAIDGLTEIALVLRDARLKSGCRGPSVRAKGTEPHVDAHQRSLSEESLPDEA
jgi:hypothetical protein